MDENITLKQGLEQFYEKHKTHLNYNKVGIPSEVQSLFKSRTHKNS
jgi:hypothetical protein